MDVELIIRVTNSNLTSDDKYVICKYIRSIQRVDYTFSHLKRPFYRA